MTSLNGWNESLPEILEDRRIRRNRRKLGTHYQVFGGDPPAWQLQEAVEYFYPKGWVLTHIYREYGRTLTLYKKRQDFSERN